MIRVQKAAGAVDGVLANGGCRIVHLEEPLPVMLQRQCVGLLVLEPTPFIQLMLPGEEKRVCDRYAKLLACRGESEAQIARFWRHADRWARPVLACDSATLLVPEALCRPLGRTIVARRSLEWGLRLVAGGTAPAESKPDWVAASMTMWYD